MAPAIVRRPTHVRRTRSNVRVLLQVGGGLDVEEAAKAARLVAINLITTMKGGAHLFIFLSISPFLALALACSIASKACFACSF